MKITDELSTLIKNYQGQTIEIAPGLMFSQYQTLKTIDFYSNSKYLKGNKDEKGRDKPFHNIVNAFVDTSVVATDIDTKDIQIIADNGKDFVRSFLLGKDVYEWMKEADFAKFLNDMGETRARYGGVIVKKCEDEQGELDIDVVLWKNVIVDPVDISKGIIIEKHYMMPSEIMAKSDVWKNCEELLRHCAKKKGYIATGAKIPVYEVHGEVPESMIKEGGSDATFSRHCFYVGGEIGDKQFVLHDMVEKESPYKYLPWKKVSGRALGRGVVEEGEEAQVSTNDSYRKEAQAMEIGAKVVFKTTSKKIGNNVTAVDNGHIIELDANEDFSQVNTLSNAIPEYRSLADRWFKQYERATSAYDAQRGETPPSGQPYRLQALIASQSSSSFDYRREEAGIFITEIFNDWVIPFLIKKLNREHILSSDFSAEELKMIDDNFARYTANQKAKDAILDGKLITQEDYLGYFDMSLNEIKGTKNQRFIQIPKDYFKDIEAKVTVITTGEQKNKQATLESLANILNTPAAQQYPDLMRDVLANIMELSGAGVSPATIATMNAPQPTQPQMPQAQPAQ